MTDPRRPLPSSVLQDLSVILLMLSFFVRMMMTVHGFVPSSQRQRQFHPHSQLHSQIFSNNRLLRLQYSYYDNYEDAAEEEDRRLAYYQEQERWGGGGGGYNDMAVPPPPPPPPPRRPLSRIEREEMEFNEARRDDILSRRNDIISASLGDDDLYYGSTRKDSDRYGDFNRQSQGYRKYPRNYNNRYSYDVQPQPYHSEPYSRGGVNGDGQRARVGGEYDIHPSVMEDSIRHDGDYILSSLNPEVPFRPMHYNPSSYENNGMYREMRNERRGHREARVRPDVRNMREELVDDGLALCDDVEELLAQIELNNLEGRNSDELLLMLAEARQAVASRLNSVNGKNRRHNFRREGRKSKSANDLRLEYMAKVASGLASYSIEGGSEQTWSYDSPDVDRVRIELSTEGLEMDAEVELQQGDDSIPYKTRVFSDDGKLRPFSTVINTPLYPNKISVVNKSEQGIAVDVIVRAIPRYTVVRQLLRTKARIRKPFMRRVLRSKLSEEPVVIVSNGEKGHDEERVYRNKGQNRIRIPTKDEKNNAITVDKADDGVLKRWCDMSNRYMYTDMSKGK